MPKFSREDTESLAKAIAEGDADNAHGFFPRVALGLQRQGKQVPAVCVQWKDLQVVTEATNSAGSLPSIPNAFASLGKVRALPWHFLCKCTWGHMPKAKASVHLDSLTRVVTDCV